MHNHHMDSTIWNDFKFRDDDIVIATYAKAGTTWMQQIVSQLLFGGNEGVANDDVSPWVDLRVPPKEVKLAMLEAQTHRRFLKTHLPVEALVISPKAKYLFIARDGRDVLWSFYNHHKNGTEEWYKELNDTPGLVGPPIGKPHDDILQYYREWIEKNGFPFWPFWENIRTWWNIRHLPNIKFVHFQNLKDDMPGQIREIADFLEIKVDEEKWPAILDHCSFEYMKNNQELIAQDKHKLFNGSFFNKGENKRWKDTLTAADVEIYEKKAVEELGPECAHWLATGKFIE
jgi:aryl sulfotransferase